jgi:cell division control protein 24
VDVRVSIKAIQTVLRHINKTIKEKEVEDQVQDLVSRVIDWRGHKVASFGTLLIYDVLDITRDTLTRRASIIHTIQVLSLYN